MSKGMRCAMALLLLACSLPGRAQADGAASNEQMARRTLAAMTQALGGEAWLHQRNQLREGRSAGFHQGKPSGAVTLFRETQAGPDKTRIEYGKSRDVVQIVVGRKGWEITYKGTAPLPREQLEAFLRQRDHSIETAMRLWLPEPGVILLYEGRHLVERRMADQVTLVSPTNNAITILVDTETHLPLRRQFEWRDPLFHDKNVEVEEYDGYRLIDGLATPLTITRYHNGEMTSQTFLTRAAYNQELAPGSWDVEAAARKPAASF